MVGSRSDVRLLLLLTRVAFEEPSRVARRLETFRGWSQARWELIARASIQHRVVALVEEALEESRRYDRLPRDARSIIRDGAARVRGRAEVVTPEVEALGSSLSRSGIPAAIVRGPAIAQHYRRPAARAFTDIDILVDRSGIVAVDELLRERGFVQGDFAPDGRSIVPTRGARPGPVHQPNRLHAYLKLCGDEPLVVEPHFELFAHDLPLRAASEDVLRHAPTDRAGVIPTLEPDGLALEALAHIFAHATSARASERGTAQRLYRWVDLAVLSAVAKPHVDWVRVGRLAAQLGIAHAVVPHARTLDLLYQGLPGRSDRDDLLRVGIFGDFEE